MSKNRQSTHRASDEEIEALALAREAGVDPVKTLQQAVAAERLFVERYTTANADGTVEERAAVLAEILRDETVKLDILASPEARKTLGMLRLVARSGLEPALRKLGNPSDAMEAYKHALDEIARALRLASGRRGGRRPAPWVRRAFDASHREEAEGKYRAALEVLNARRECVRRQKKEAVSLAMVLSERFLRDPNLRRSVSESLPHDEWRAAGGSGVGGASAGKLVNHLVVNYRALVEKNPSPTKLRRALGLTVRPGRNVQKTTR